MGNTVSLTEKQAQVADFIAQFIEERGFFPRYEDVRLGLGLRSKSEVYRYMKVLERKGVIVRGTCPRDTRLVWDGSAGCTV